MSDSESFGSAKDNDYKESSAEPASSDDEPLSKTKNNKSPKKAKSPKKKSTKPQKGRPIKAKQGRPTKAASGPIDPLAETDDVEEEYEVEAIVGHREYNGKLVYKIRWKNYDPVHDTWETFDSLSCPDLLEMYNIKHSVVVPSAILKKKRGATSTGGSSKKQKKKPRRSSLTDESEVENGDGGGDDDEEYEVDKIIDSRNKRDGSREFLVHWKRWSSDYDTWEPEEHLSCPDIIAKFLKRVEVAKSSSSKDLRINRKHTEHFTLNTHDSGRRLSKRNTDKQRVKYYDAEGDDA